MKASIIIAARTGSRPTLNALASVHRLQRLSNLEIIVVNCCGSETRKEIREVYPDIKILDCPPTKTLLEARCLGTQNASGDPVTCLHERYAVTDAWLEAIEYGHREGADVVAGVLTPGTDLTTTQWAIYLAEYSHITAPMHGGITGLDQSNALPFGNMSYTQRVLEKDPMANATSELEFAIGLYNSGAHIIRSNGMAAVYESAPSLSEYLAERWQVSRDYARLRASGMGFGGRAFAAIARLLLPPLLIARVLKNSLRNPVLRWKVWRPLPFIAMFTVAQMFAEIQGYFAPGNR